MSILILTAPQVQALLSMTECITVMEDALTALTRGQVFQPVRTLIRPPTTDGIMVLMPAYLEYSPAARYYGLKAICVFHDNPKRGMDAHQGAVLLYSGETGELIALMNASAITAIRTAAVSGLATRLLARPDAGNLAIIGSGVQARVHLQAISCVRPIQRVKVASRHLESAQRFATELASQVPFPIEAMVTVEEAVRDADIVVTATTAAAPILERSWIAPGTHINAVGAYTPITREIDTATMAAARLVVDRRESALHEAGDVLIPIQEGAFGPEHIYAELGEVLLGTKEGRVTSAEITLFKSLGLPIEDLAAAEYLYRKAQEQSVGTTASY